VAGPYSWVGGVIVLCVFSSLLLFLCFCWFLVSCSSHFCKITLIAVAEVYVAGPYSWVGGGLLYCVCSPLCCYFCVSAAFQFGYLGRVSCSSQLVFGVFIGVHGLASIRVRFLFLLLYPPP